jgi:DNA topoisomerase-1
VIPPAWKMVWISPHPNAHIQVVGTDVAGRRQYLYHEQWQEERAEEKFIVCWSCPSSYLRGALISPRT